MGAVILALTLQLSGDGSEVQLSDVQLLNQGDEAERMRAARRVGERKDKDAVDTLIQNLNHPNQYVRGWAAWALGEIGDPAAIAPLEQAIARYRAMVPNFNHPQKGVSLDGFFRETKCLEDMYPALRKLRAKRIASFFPGLPF